LYKYYIWSQYSIGTYIHDTGCSRSVWARYIIIIYDNTIYIAGGGGGGDSVYCILHRKSTRSTCKRENVFPAGLRRYFREKSISTRSHVCLIGRYYGYTYHTEVYKYEYIYTYNIGIPLRFPCRCGTYIYTRSRSLFSRT